MSVNVGTCPTCDGKVSKAAAFCPHCGHPGANSHPMSVAVRDVEMHFGSMVAFLVKLSIASIPALIILTVLVLFVVGLMGGLGGLASLAGRH